jgi:hypothetical protein
MYSTFSSEQGRYSDLKKVGIAHDSQATSQTQTQNPFSSHKNRCAYKSRVLERENT